MRIKAPAIVCGVQGVLRCTVPLWKQCWRDCRWGTWLPTSLRTMAGVVFVTTETIRFLATFLSFLSASKIKSNVGIPAVGWKGECLRAKCRQRLCRCEKAHRWEGGNNDEVQENFCFFLKKNSVSLYLKGRLRLLASQTFGFESCHLQYSWMTSVRRVKVRLRLQLQPKPQVVYPH